MSNHFEIAIIGAGPAGIGAATNAAHHGMSHILFEKAEVANTIYDYQLRKHVMAEPNRLPLRAKCRFEAGSREKVIETFADDLKIAKTNVVRAEVTSIKKEGDVFKIGYQGTTCTATRVILTIGVQGTPRKLGVPGEDAPHVAYTLADPDAFSGKSIFVVGAGDAAIENAIALSEKNKVFLVNRSGEFARAKDANARLILEAIEKGKIRCFYNATIKCIEPGKLVVNTPDGEVDSACDHLIARLGGILPRKFLETCGIVFPSADPSSVPTVSSSYESNVPGLYVLGALIGYPLIKQAINQGYEVIEHIRGNPIDPADQPLLEERFEDLPGKFKENFPKVQGNLPLFSELSGPQLREMLIDSSLFLYGPGKVVFLRNDYTDTFWSIIEGSVDVELGNGKTIKLGKGEFFGELGLISGRRRTATIRAAEPNTLLLETPRKQIIKLMNSVVAVKRTLDETFMMRTLQLSLFPEADKAFLSRVVKQATMKNFKKGDVLFKEGDIGDAVYVIRKGSVKISRRNKSGTDVTQTYVPAGNYVGEMALLEPGEGRRSATVSAAVACETIMMERGHFLEVLNEFPNALSRVTQTARARAVENVTTDWSAQSGTVLDFMMKEGLSDAENVLLIDSDRCVACDNCESACAATHGGYSRLDRKGGKSFASIQVPISCRHCENPLCMLDCPPDALVRMSNGEVVIRDSCIGCGNCASNCPYGVIQLVYDKKSSGFSLLSMFKKKEKGPAKAAKCDLCRDLPGGPACVRACPTGAAMRVNPTKLVQILSGKGQGA